MPGGDCSHLDGLKRSLSLRDITFALLILGALLLPRPGGAAEIGEYAGSDACQGCHTYIYKQWRTTRHSFSVKTGAEAKAAGYPLPQPRPGSTGLTIRSWDDVSYVIGGRQWIAYADAKGMVQDTAYHHRIGRWDAFPSKPMAVCGTCHYTGFGAGPRHPENPVLPGRWVERNIACEACHGPGARHAETLEKADIKVSPSSRVCGQCHTAVNKILPKGELHKTHDLVQDWNQDRHVTGVRSHSHNAFCSSCHAPYRGHLSINDLAGERKVFTEDKQNITCVGCHDPHQTTSTHYPRDKAVLTSPQPIRSHTLVGDDGDFTTTDHKEWENTEQVCLQCHRGADRVDLDHANATCNDCHNTYKRNHEPATRQVHDSNHPGLSCRGCHQNGDHLMAILFADPDFLEPRHIHNLRKLPAAVRAKYGLRYDGYLPAERIATAQLPAKTPASQEQKTGTTPAKQAVPSHRESLAMSVRTLLQGPNHKRLAGDEDVGVKQAGLIEAPYDMGRHIDLAESYAAAGDFVAAREILRHGLNVETSRILLAWPFDGTGDADSDAIATVADARSRARALLPPDRFPNDQALRLWLQGHVLLSAGQFDKAAQALSEAQDHLSQNPSLSVHVALAELGRGRPRAAFEELEASRDANPDHQAVQVAMGFVQMARQRSGSAVEVLQQVTGNQAAEATAYFFLGRAYLSSGKLAKAVPAFRSAVKTDPDLLIGWFALARTYLLGGRPDAAAGVYQEIIQRQPKLFAARFELAEVLKLLSDRIIYRLRSAREGPTPANVSQEQWRQNLREWRVQADKFRDLALSELAIAAGLNSSSPDVARQVAEIYRQSGRFSEAVRFYQWLAKYQPSQWLHQYRLGVIRFRQGRFEDAVSHLQKALAMAPTEGDIYVALGLAQTRAGQLEAAIATFEQGTIYEPFNPALYTNLGAAHATKGDLDRAERMLHRSLELHSFPLPRVHLTETNLALVYIKQGEVIQARQALRRALHRYPGYTLARDLLTRLDEATDGGVNVGTGSFVFNEMLERFGEVTSVALGND